VEGLVTNHVQQTSNSPSGFSEQHLREFLRSGFIFGLGPDRLVIGWGEFKKSQTPSARKDARSVCSVYAPDFYLEREKPWLIAKDFKIVTQEFFTTHVLSKMTTEVKDFRWTEPSRESFERQFTLIQNAFRQEGLKKAVPVVHASCVRPIGESDLTSMLTALSRLPQTLTPYGFWRSDDTGVYREGLLGATPEYLFSVKGSTLKTMALAGTRSKAESPDGGAALMADPKERHEHQLVIDDIQAVLSKFGAVKIGTTFAAELPTLFHLKTPIEVELKATSDNEGGFEQLATALHPTPALGLSPRALGLGFLKRWDEVEDRGRFGAPFGVDLQLEDGSRVQDCVVGIRNIQWSDERVLLGSGCGVVPESQSDREWAELKLKRDSVRKILGI
jgi:menaquinone-specific isochorismate synthase